MVRALRAAAEVTGGDANHPADARFDARDLAREGVRLLIRRGGTRREDRDERRPGKWLLQKPQVIVAPMVCGWITFVVARTIGPGRAEPPEYPYSSNTFVP